ncbi:hypothetical protein [Rubritalea profundi]|uniref:Uncharacterized protein n=1 Tax=Rubritalea profundi TaxID=1658618 RepID=A0A2S7U227_9BACT|nr:hypothetical protein [Rubritalea profundi]PQJ28233.1 hypothetical protein BSZ32_06755 [Rubritalea profundi]
MKKTAIYWASLSLASLPASAQNSNVRLQGINPSGIESKQLSADQAIQSRRAGSTSKRKPLTPAQQRSKIIEEIKINRSNSGIIETRMAVKRTPLKIEKLSEAQLKKLTPAQQITRFKLEVKQIQNDVILSNWPQLKESLAALQNNEATQIYSQILQQLSQPARISPKQEIAATGARSHTQAQYFPPADLLPLADACPSALSPQTLKILAKLIGPNNRPLPSFFEELKKGNSALGLGSEITKSNTAELLILSGLLGQVSPYIPDQAKAQKENDYKALDLLSQYHSAAHQAKMGKQHLPIAWELSRYILSHKEAPYSLRGKSLYRALSLLPELDEDSGREWLKKTFADTDSEGFEILSAVGILSSQTRQNQDANFRLEQLQLQAAAANALIQNTTAATADWSELLTLYLRNWNHEAEHSYKLDSSTSLRPEMQSDRYGNIFYGARQPQSRSSISVSPIRSGDLLELAPSNEWLDLVQENVRMNYLTGASKLFLKVKEEGKAFPLLKEIASTRPETAKDLIREMIRVWADNHNPNAKNNRYRSRYFYMYGMNQRAESIPLTRSKQERNLKELSELIAQVKSLDLDDKFQKEFAEAFTSAHSTAEVWRLETLKKVFGSTKEIEPEVVASLLSRMRTNLAGLWPKQKLQIDAKTKRTDKEQQAQVLRGYAMALGLCKASLNHHPDQWRLMVQMAALTLEESNYKSSIGSNSEHSSDKLASMELFAKAADAYIATLPLDKESDESVQVFTDWFYGSLGSSILEALKSHHQPMNGEFTKIKSTLEKLDTIDPGAAERHLAKFTKVLNQRLANVGPDLKFRYLKSAIDLVGDHANFADGNTVYQYYQDLVTEVKLDSYVDGSSEVSASEPFGLYINLRHTREIEREASGFQKYLVNQSNTRSGYNYGRPAEDYRDKFEKSARAALTENFEIVSITFHNSKVQSRTDKQQGWTLTPYAYIQLKPKGPQVDTIPPLKIDLDFLDTSGYVVLPITSPAIPISANNKTSDRPHRDLKVTMVLDERELDKEKTLKLEIKSSAHGTVPQLDKMLQLPPKGYKVVSIDDRELQIVELDATTDDLAPLSTHEWVVTLATENEAKPTEFSFPELLLPTAKEEGLTLQRYDDVDLVSVEKTISLTETETAGLQPWYFVAGALVLGITGFLTVKSRKAAPVTGPSNVIALPTDLTPVTLLSYLEKISQSPSLNDEQKAKLELEIGQLQASYFGPEALQTDEDNLKSIAQTWQKAV